MEYDIAKEETRRTRREIIPSMLPYMLSLLIERRLARLEVPFSPAELFKSIGFLPVWNRIVKGILQRMRGRKRVFCNLAFTKSKMRWTRERGEERGIATYS